MTTLQRVSSKSLPNSPRKFRVANDLEELQQELNKRKAEGDRSLLRVRNHIDVILICRSKELKILEGYTTKEIELVHIERYGSRN